VLSPRRGRIILGMVEWEASKPIRLCASHLNHDYPFDKTEDEATLVYGLQ
jgi:hypothetical protein